MKDLEEIEEFRTFYPTEEEFKTPIQYIESLYDRHAHQFGCIKIVPPSSYKPPFCFDMESDAKMPARI